jgi:hypothetical protein
MGNEKSLRLFGCEKILSKKENGKYKGIRKK